MVVRRASALVGCVCAIAAITWLGIRLGIGLGIGLEMGLGVGWG